MGFGYLVNLFKSFHGLLLNQKNFRIAATHLGVNLNDGSFFRIKFQQQIYKNKKRRDFRE